MLDPLVERVVIAVEPQLLQQRPQVERIGRLLRRGDALDLGRTERLGVLRQIVHDQSLALAGLQRLHV